MQVDEPPTTSHVAAYPGRSVRSHPGQDCFELPSLAISPGLIPGVSANSSAFGKLAAPGHFLRALRIGFGVNRRLPCVVVAVSRPTDQPSRFVTTHLRFLRKRAGGVHDEYLRNVGASQIHDVAFQSIYSDCQRLYPRAPDCGWRERRMRRSTNALVRRVGL